MSLNKNGELRKTRENRRPTNHKWTKAEAAIAFFCYKGGVNVETKEEVADRLDVSDSQLSARINEFQIYTNTENKIEKPERVCQMTMDVYNEYDFKKEDECAHDIDLFLNRENDQLSSETEEVEDVQNTPATIEDIVKVSPLIELIKTKTLIDSVIQEGTVDYPGKYINSKNLVVLNCVEDLDYISSGLEGCYFIFSNLPIERIPVLSAGGVESYNKSFLPKENNEFRCLYNGKGNSVKERLKVHLFNSHTLKKIENTKKTICGTGAMSLASLPASEFTKLQAMNQYYPEKHKLKPVSKSIQPESKDKRTGDAFFLNGIDITEHPWTDFKFGVIVLKSDSEFGKILIEEAFCKHNGRPPLCRRHG